MNTTIARNALATSVIAQSTASLTTMLKAIPATPDEAERLVASIITLELTERFPHLDDALDAWCDDLESTLTYNEVVLANL